jgi:hypothetical protein
MSPLRALHVRAGGVGAGAAGEGATGGVTCLPESRLLMKKAIAIGATTKSTTGPACGVLKSAGPTLGASVGHLTATLRAVRHAVLE